MGKNYQTYIAGVTSPQRRLKELKTRVAPVDATRMIEARRAYRMALTGIKKTAWEAWLHT